ncbi:Uma2 family endonuclease [Emticicia sp. W12TSBA100-4]|uniref:Uma2 family endonuclease n=1 Tax=Emticicia sp. W12TSBA100-4 TaxID=3160965 RepID=UPI003305DC01
MGDSALKKELSIKEYIELEEKSLQKNEYFGGEIYAMAGGKPSHALISNNIAAELRNSLKGKPCLAYNSDLAIATAEDEFVYADASVVCGEIESYAEHPNAAKNPILIVEVLSDSSEKYDRGEKFRKYQQIESLREYLLIAQDRVRVEVYSKHDNIIFWQYRSYESLNDTIDFKSINCNIALSDIYLGWKKEA